MNRFGFFGDGCRVWVGGWESTGTLKRFHHTSKQAGSEADSEFLFCILCALLF